MFSVFWSIVCMCIHVQCTCSALRGQKRALDSLDLDLQMVAIHHVGCKNQTQILCKAASTLNFQTNYPGPSIAFLDPVLLAIITFSN